MNYKKLFYITLLSLVLPFLQSVEAKEWKAAEMVHPFTIDSTDYIYDPLGYLGKSMEDSLNALCADFNHKVNMELAIVLLDKIDEEPFDFGLELYNHWRLGRGSRGLLLTILVEQHRWQFNTGDGAEGVYPDGLLYQVGEHKLVPKFRSEDYAGGIHDALNELYQIAAAEDPDSYFEANNYDKSRFTNTEEETTWFDWVMYAYLLILFLIGVIDSAASDDSTSIKDSLGTFLPTQYSNGRNYISYKCKNDSKNVSVWANSGCLRYILVDIGFFVVICFSAEDENSFLYVALGLLAYVTYWALSWFITAEIKLLRASHSDSRLKYFGYKTLQDNMALSGFKTLVPWIGYPMYAWFKRQSQKHLKKLLVCPTCQREATLVEGKESFAETDSELFEEKEKITQRLVAQCPFGHTMVINMPGENYFNYSDCQYCGGHTATLQEKNVLKEATYEYKGLIEKIYLCQGCHQKTSVEEETKKLDKPNYSTSSSDGGFFGGFSGGSSGGGSSSGGGAGGSW